MPRLIVLNGPPAAGKSTLARRWADEHPLALALNVDVLREMLGGWRADPHAAGLFARDMAVAAAGVHLAAGYDVLVPQLLARQEFPELARSPGRRRVRRQAALVPWTGTRACAATSSGGGPGAIPSTVGRRRPTSSRSPRCTQPVAAFVAMGGGSAVPVESDGEPDAVYARLAAALAD